MWSAPAPVDDKIVVSEIGGRVIAEESSCEHRTDRKRQRELERMRERDHEREQDRERAPRRAGRKRHDGADDEDERGGRAPAAPRPGQSR